ncbi:MAG: hypothetical protein ACJ76F_10625 [Bacteroidia bacterium]
MKTLFLITPLTFFLLSCNPDTEPVNNNRERDSLVSLLEEKDSSINELLISFTEVERNLDSVASKQQLIYLSTANIHGELKQKQKEHINAQISAINNLMEENRQKLEDLNKKLKGSRRKNVQLEKVIATLNEQIAQKDTELSALNDRLNSLNVQVAQLQTSIDTLNIQNLSQSNTINDRTTELHTAYYIVGGSKELREAKLIDKKGGLLGMGKTLKLNENADNSKFTRIDYTKTPNIDVYGDHVKIVTTHPSDSYTLEKDEKDKNIVKNIIINNPEKFWSISKYLVVVKD